MDIYVTKPRIQKIYFSLFSFEHQYLAYYNNLTPEIFSAQRKHSNLVMNVLDFFIGPSYSSHFIKSRKKNEKNWIKVFRFLS